MAESITAASLRTLKPRGRMYEVTDARLPGFLVRVLPSGKKVFFVRHRAHGRDERVRLGPWSDALPLDEARRQAMAILAGHPAPPPSLDLEAPDSAPDDDLDDPRPARPRRARDRRDHDAHHSAPPPRARDPRDLNPAPAPSRPRDRRGSDDPAPPSRPPRARDRRTADDSDSPPRPRDRRDSDHPASPSRPPRASDRRPPDDSDPPPRARDRRGPNDSAPPSRPPRARDRRTSDDSDSPPRARDRRDPDPPPVPAPRGASPRRTREPLEPRPSQITIRQLAARFEREYIDVYLKPGSAYNYRRHLRDHILPAFGDRPIDQVSRADLRALHARLSDRPALADYVVCVVGSFYSRIIDDWELADLRNPAAGVRRFGSRRRERFLSPAERSAVLAEIDAGLRVQRGKPGHIEPFSAWALRLLMLTGQRRDEILTLRWSMVDWQHASIHFPDTKTGQRSVAISRETLALLREIHDATGNPRSGLVLRGRNGTKITAINRTWDRIREAVGIPDVRLHDLRHSFASDALMAGVPLAIVGELLGHRQPTTTKRYAHLADHVVRDALELATQRMLDIPPAPSPQSTPAPRPPPATRSAPTSSPQPAAPPPTQAPHRAAIATSPSPHSATALSPHSATSAEPPFVPLTDAQWARVIPLVAADRPRRGPPIDLRRLLDGVRWVLHHRARWHDLPAAYGTPTTAWRWHKRWTEDDTWTRITELLA